MIDSDEKRKYVFWRYCFLNRLALAMLTTIAHFGNFEDVELILAGYLSGWGGSLLYKFVYGLQEEYLKEQLQKELTDSDRNRIDEKLYTIQYGNFGGKVWWKQYRLIHGANLLIYSVSTLLGYPNAYIFPIIDIMFTCAVGVSHFNLCA